MYLTSTGGRYASLKSSSSPVSIAPPCFSHRCTITTSLQKSLSLHCAFSFGGVLFVYSAVPVDSLSVLSRALHSPFPVEILSKLTLLLPTQMEYCLPRISDVSPFPCLLVFPVSSISAVKHNFHGNQAISKCLCLPLFPGSSAEPGSEIPVLTP